MTATQFRHRLKALGISQLEAARCLGVDPRTARRWALNETRIPTSVALLLDAWVRDARARRPRQRGK